MTIEEFYNEAMKNESLMREIDKAGDENRLARLLQERHVDGTEQQFLDFVKEKNRIDHELSDDDLENATGGKSKSGYDDLIVIRRDSKGRPIQWQQSGRKWHYLCNECNIEWMHEGTSGAVYCDLCDHFKFGAGKRGVRVWDYDNGTLEAVGIPLQLCK